MLLVLVLGSLFQLVSFGWGLLATEVFLIFLPSYLLHRRKGIPLKEQMWITKPRAGVALVALLLGSGAWLVDTIIETFTIQITGYTPPAIAGVIPTTPLEAILVFLGFAIAAPICEELLFRGTIQRTYHQEKNAYITILITALMFIGFHMRLQGFVALIPIALIIGFVYWRTKSLVAVILVHFANNFMAALVMIQAGLFPDFPLPFPTVQTAAFGILMIIAGLFLLVRLTPDANDAPTPTEHAATGIRTYWALFVAVVIFAIVAVLEVASSGLLGALELDAAQLPQKASYSYAVQHKGGEQVGTAHCAIEQKNLAVFLDCSREIEAFEYQEGNSFYASGDVYTDLDISWNIADLSLYQLSLQNTSEDHSSQWQVETLEDELVLHVNANNTPIDFSFPATSLVEEEWPWRLMGLPFATNYFAQASYLEPMVWRQATQDNGPVLNENSFIYIQGQEEINTAAGTFTTWKVSLDNQNAWYDVNAPHVLIQFETRMFDYQLSEFE